MNGITVSPQEEYRYRNGFLLLAIFVFGSGGGFVAASVLVSPDPVDTEEVSQTVDRMWPGFEKHGLTDNIDRKTVIELFIRQEKTKSRRYLNNWGVGSCIVALGILFLHWYLLHRQGRDPLTGVVAQSPIKGNKDA